jgi:hypothetical protein
MVVDGLMMQLSQTTLHDAVLNSNDSDVDSDGSMSEASSEDERLVVSKAAHPTVLAATTPLPSQPVGYTDRPTVHHVIRTTSGIRL